MSRSRLTVLTLSTALLTPACAADFGGDLGITAGGSQDIRLAREIIEDGGVPEKGQFTAEGLFSEHDIPTPESEPCTELLCPRAALAEVSPVDGSGERVLVQLGFDTNIVEFHRNPLNLALVVDISGSMEGEKLASTKQALHSLADQLDAGDRASLVAFDDEAELRLASTVMDAQGLMQLHAVISALEVDGATNIEAGLARGYASMAEHVDGSGGREDRVMLFTDAQPNVGPTDSQSFVGQAQAGAEQGVGISVFGIGLDLGAELANAIGQVRGGNSFYLGDADAIASVFDDEFDMIVTPVAYDLHFDVRPAEPFSFVAAYGAPDAAPAGNVEVSLATAFLSERNGAMAVLLDGPIDVLEGGETVVSFALDHTTLEGQHISQNLDAKWLGGALPIAESGHADGPGVAKLAVLLDAYLALSAAAETCYESLPQAEALARIDEAAARLDAVGDALGDQPLHDTADLLRQLSENVTARC
jgi:Ca-activated chloride channel family protein